MFEKSIEGSLDKRRVSGMGDDDSFNREVALSWKQSSLKYKDFISSPFPFDEVETDRKRVEDIRKTSTYVHDKSSEAVDLEYVLMEGIKVSGWFGDEVEGVRKTTEYDDVINGTDFVVSFYDEKNECFINLAVDATTSSDELVLTKKLDKIIQRLRHKELTKIKYFEDPDGKKGPVAMPSIVLGLEPEETVRLQKMFVEKRGETEDTSHQFKFLSMAKLQLIEWLDYSLRRHRITAPGQFLENFEQAADILEKNKKEIEKDAALQIVVEPIFNALRFIERAEKEKSSLGPVMDSKRAEPFALGRLANLESLRSLE